MEKQWRLIIDGALPAERNMAVDDAMFRLCSAGRQGVYPTLRFYQWKNPTLSFGSSQKFDRAVDEAYCKKAGYDIVRRPTGGRAVLHHIEATYSVVAPVGEEFGQSIQETYRLVSEGILQGLISIGIKAETEGKDGAERSDSLTYLPCFSSSTKYELAFEGKKIVGSAQRRSNNAFLQHGSILIDFNSEELLRSIGAGEDAEDPGNYMTSISRILGRDVGYREVVEHIAIGFEKAYGLKLTEQGLTDEEKDVAAFFESTKYNTDDWNKTR
jgi:lipoate-protein ligase A